jgi:phosphatidylserine decarboxylase
VNPHESGLPRLPFAPEASAELILATCVVLALWIARAIWPGPVHLGLALLATLAWIGLLFFMRDPNRTPPTEEGIYLAPADGKVVAIDRVDEADFVGRPTVRVAIFLSLFDVHVNRSPVSGTVRKVRHVPGRFLQAFREEASKVNEYNDIGVEDGSERLLVKQIAGILARRIVCTVKEGDRISAGQRVGMIKFGSRTEVFLPPDSRVEVQCGDKVRGGLTILARRQG